MRIKSYFSGTVEAAMELARRELGPDAMILNSRRSSDHTRHLGEYEVVFALSRDAAAEPQETAAPRGPRTLVELSGQVAGLERQVERLASCLVTTHETSAPELHATAPSGASGLAGVYSFLIARDVAAAIATRVVEAIGTRLTREASGLRPASALTGRLGAGLQQGSGNARPGLITTVFKDQSLLQQLLVAELEGLFAVDPTLGRPDSKRKVVALVGPPGAGKTTALVKLAVRFGSLSRRPACILSADTQRIAAADQLRAYAAIAGLGFEPVETIHALERALEEHRSKELILIDTPGFAPGEMEQATELARFLSGHPEVDCHLVLSASSKCADLSRAAERYGAFQPAKLLFTRLDETESTGSLLSEAAFRGKAISFLSKGQSIPEDMEEASKERLMDLLIGDVWVAGSHSPGASPPANASFAHILRECREHQWTGPASAVVAA